jgi:3-hydroxy acid dehydrogenase/malonic semialdehyde reductase
MSLLFSLVPKPTLLSNTLTASAHLLSRVSSSIRPSRQHLSSVLCQGRNNLIRTMASSAAAKRLAGKTVLITGASSGIGRSTALEFARTSPSDLRLILTARRIDSLKEVASQIAQEVGQGVKVLPVKLDISNPDEVRGFVAALPEEWRDINVLVNNA